MQPTTSNNNHKNQQTKEENDRIVIRTNDEATLCKNSLVQKKYIVDPFVSFFYHQNPPSHQGSVNSNMTRISPLINRGYFARIYSINRLISDFLKTVGALSSVQSQLSDSHKSYQCQIVSIGAGFDTRVFQLKAENTATTTNSSSNSVSSLFYNDTSSSSSSNIGMPSVRYIEVDFESVARQKANIIYHSQELRSLLSLDESHLDGSSSSSGGSGDHNTSEQEEQLLIHSDQYVLIGGDLRQEKSLDMLKQAIDPNVPTLFFSEMALIYMDTFYSDRLIETCKNSVKKHVLSMFIIYESIHPNDAFGRMMVMNLKNRGCDLKSIETYPDCESMRQRMNRFFLTNDSEEGKDNNASSFAVSYDMNSICNNILPFVDKNWMKERIRTNRLEMVDEVEEYDLLMQHYALTVAVNSYVELENVKDTWLHRLYTQQKQTRR